MLQKNVCLSEAAAAAEASNIIIAAVLHILDAQGSSDATANALLKVNRQQQIFFRAN